MIVEVPVSVGELIDKITILRIKVEKIETKDKAAFASQELDLLVFKLATLPGGRDQFAAEEKELFKINNSLWEIEDRLRELEYEKRFDDEFIQLARQVYMTNDERFRVKNEINAQVSSAVREVKSYKSYDPS